MNEFQLLPEQASTIADDIDLLTWWLTGITVFFMGIIVIAIVYLGIKYRQKAHPKPEEVHGSMTLEITWTVIPLLICMVLFWWGTKLFMYAMTPPADGMQFYVTGKQWMWKIQHPTGHREINTLHVPAGEKVILTMTSEDVLHDFYIPAFRAKNDVIPGYYTKMWFEAKEESIGKDYHLFCAEYCGTEHSLMIGKVHVMSRPDYDAWLAAQEVVESPAVVGKRLYEKLQCATCHDAGDSQKGPSLHDRFGTEVQLADGGTATFDEAHIRESLLKPAARVSAGFETKMSSYSQLEEEEILLLVEYIKSLNTKDEVAAVTGGENR